MAKPRTTKPAQWQDTIPPPRPEPAGATPPHSKFLTIARTAGGFVLLDPDVTDGRTYDLTPLDAVAVAATPDALAAQIINWALAPAASRNGSAA